MSFFIFFPPSLFLRTMSAGFSSAGFGQMNVFFIVHEVLKTYKPIFLFFYCGIQHYPEMRRTKEKKRNHIQHFLTEKGRERENNRQIVREIWMVSQKVRALQDSAGRSIFIYLAKKSKNKLILRKSVL